MLLDAVVGHEVWVMHVMLVVGEVDGTKLAADFVESNGSIVKHLLIFVVVNFREPALLSLLAQSVCRCLSVHDQDIKYIIFFQSQIRRIIRTWNRTCIILFYFTGFLNYIGRHLRWLHVPGARTICAIGSTSFRFIYINYFMGIKYKLLHMLRIIQTNLRHIPILVIILNRHGLLFHLVKSFNIRIVLQNRIQNFILLVKIRFELFFHLILQYISLVDVHAMHHEEIENAKHS